MPKLSELNPTDKLKVLIYGDSGTGKTCFATSFPGPVFVHDFDGKINSAAGFWAANNRERLGQIEYENYSTGSVQERYSRFYTWLVGAEKECKWGTVVLDSLTLFNELLMKEIMRQNSAIRGPAPGVPGMQHYGVFAVNFKEQLTRFLALNANVVVTAHIDISKDEVTGEVIRRPLVSGKNASWLPVVFGEVYRSYAESKDSKIAYRAQTKTDARYNCRSQIHGLADHIDLTYNALIRHVTDKSTKQPT